MRYRFFLLLVPLTLCAPTLAQKAADTPSTLEVDPKGWFDLFPGQDLAGWKRVPILPDTKLDPRNPWKVMPQEKILHCDGVGIKEMLLFDRNFKDGVLHVEWRFPPVSDKKFGYNGGLYVRTAPTGQTWVQSQVAMLEKPPFVADLFADILVDGKVQRVQSLGTGHERVRPVGQWNTHEVTCKGKTITAWLNGAMVTTWNDCPLPQGFVGLQAEFFAVEFRNLKFKEIGK